MILKVGETDEGSFSNLSGVDKKLFPTFTNKLLPSVQSLALINVL